MRAASREFMAGYSQEKVNGILLGTADAIGKNSDRILQENAKDLSAMDKNNPKFDRLRLTPERLESIASDMRKVASLPSPVGQLIEKRVLPNGLELSRVRVPFGVIGIIYEARPNVTADAIGLCLKSGNAVILRGGSEAITSNKILSSILADAAYSAGIPEGAVQFVSITDHSAVDVMMRLNKYIDVIIPRGGAGLIKRVVENSSVPVIETGVGICHIYVDDKANTDMATKIIINAKTTRPAVCNAVETVLIHQSIADKFLPVLSAKLKEYTVEIRGCEKCRQICPDLKPATDEDWSTEYGDLILSVKIVDDVTEAIDHINKFGSGHSEAIITDSYKNALLFQRNVDAAAVYVNASTRFTDGNEFGFGAEIGISTQKLHARGPMGLEALTTMKYLIYGEGQTR